MKALTNQDIKKTLVEIAKKTFQDIKIPYFDLKLVNKKNERFHGIYYFPGKNKWGKYQNGKIEIHNLTRNAQYIISTAIHELAHHCDFTYRKTTDHSRKFYEIYMKLLQKTIELGYIDYEIARKATDVGDLYQLEKYFKNFFEKINQNENKNWIIKINLNFAEGKILKSKDYIYSKIEKCWTVEKEKTEIKKEIEKIKKYIKKEHIKIYKSISELNYETKAVLRIQINKKEYQNLNLKLKESKNYKFNSEKKYWEKIILKINQKNEIEKLYKNGITEETAIIMIL